jgi:Na+/citrate or Na+/malate symporter
LVVWIWVWVALLSVARKLVLSTFVWWIVTGCIGIVIVCVGRLVVGMVVGIMDIGVLVW